MGKQQEADKVTEGLKELTMDAETPADDTPTPEPDWSSYPPPGVQGHYPGPQLITTKTPAFPTRKLYEQRGNYPTFAVQWTGDNEDEVVEFIRGRGGCDFHTVTDNGLYDLIFGFEGHYLVLPILTWLVDQGNHIPLGSRGVWSFVMCEYTRFNHLYREVPRGQKSTAGEQINEEQRQRMNAELTERGPGDDRG